MPPEFSTDWMSPNLPEWERHLAAYRGKPDLRFLEVGAFEGRSACWLLEHVLTHPSSRLTVIDPFLPFHLDRWKHGFPGKPGYPPPTTVHFEARFDANMEAVGAGERLVKRKGRSREILRELPLESFDFIFIDGSHAPFDVLRDATLCWDLLKTGGILAFDDYLLHSFTEPYYSPRMAIDAFMAIAIGRHETLAAGWQMWLRKTEPPPPPDPLAPLQTSAPETEEARRNRWSAAAQSMFTSLWRSRR